jgi:Lar family restriction alleviation protein
VKPCPFCGTDKTFLYASPSDPAAPNATRVVCVFCGAMGPISVNDEQARAVWDARKPAPATPRRPKYVPCIDHDEDLNA